MSVAWRDFPPLARGAAIIGTLGLLACIAGGIVDRAAFFQAWLIDWLFLLGIALAAMMDVMIHELTGGQWGRALRPPLEAAAATLPLVALLAVPLAFGLPDLFLWARPDVVARSDVLQAKHWYLNAPSFIVRNSAWLIAWSALAWMLRRHLGRAAGGDGAASSRRIAIAGLLTYLVTITLAAFDWVASLTPEWFSSAIGIRLGAAQFVAAFAFAVPFAVVGSRRNRGAKPATARDFQDLGNLLLTFTMTWAYFAFSQYLIVWGEDLPRETSWYWPRTQTNWHYLAFAIAALNFVLPVAALLFRDVKRNANALALLCGFVLLGQWLDTFWLIAPSLRPQGFELRWQDIAAVVAQGGLWLALVAIVAQRLSVPTPRSPTEAAAHG